MNVYIQLEDGKIFTGSHFGGKMRTVGGTFTVSSCMIGHQEIITDPSNIGKLMVFTYPLVGGYGMNFADNQSDQPVVEALIIREKMDHATNFRSEMNLNEYLRYHDIVGVEDVDTRGLIAHLRKNGPQRGIITTRLRTPSQMGELLEGQNPNVIEEVSVKEIMEIEGAGKKVAVWDFGIKNSCLNALSDLGFNLRVYPAMVNFDEILEDEPELLFLSSGPGNAAHYTDLVKDIRQVMGQVPIFAMGLGAQLLGLALGATLTKLPMGHYGTSLAVRELEGGAISMTAQNHDYTLTELEGAGAEVSHRNVADGSVEGFRHLEKRAHGVLFDPFGKSGADDLAGDITELLKNL
ncbi:MAG: carbamoyl phosphate synthase small subunit [Tissierellia bacterium]|nr:carbamoyl phosphate synthase small subunit [Tissierellia bacterium]